MVVNGSHPWFSSALQIDRMTFVAKELFHRYQFLMGRHAVDPFWLYVGSARFSANKVVPEDWILNSVMDPLVRITSYDDSRPWRVNSARGVEKRLNEMDTWESWHEVPVEQGNNYSILAAELLAARAGEAVAGQILQTLGDRLQLAGTLSRMRSALPSTVSTTCSKNTEPPASLNPPNSHSLRSPLDKSSPSRNTTRNLRTSRTDGKNG